MFPLASHSEQRYLHCFRHAVSVVWLAWDCSCKSVLMTSTEKVSICRSRCNMLEESSELFRCKVTVPFNPSKRPFQQTTLSVIGTIVGKPGGLFLCPNINRNQGRKIQISKSCIMNVKRTLRSGKNVVVQNPLQEWQFTRNRQIR